MQKPKSFEQAMIRIDEIVNLLERGEIALDDALAMFEEATSLVRRCESLLKDAEQKISLLTSAKPDNANGSENNTLTPEVNDDDV